MYRYGCIQGAKLLSSLSAKEADSIVASKEDDSMQSFDDVTFKTWARSLTDHHSDDVC